MKLSKEFFIEYYKHKISLLKHRMDEEIHLLENLRVVSCIESFKEISQDICFYTCLLHVLENK